MDELKSIWSAEHIMWSWMHFQIIIFNFVVVVTLAFNEFSIRYLVNRCQITCHTAAYMYWVVCRLCSKNCILKHKTFFNADECQRETRENVCNKTQRIFERKQIKTFKGTHTLKQYYYLLAKKNWNGFVGEICHNFDYISNWQRQNDDLLTTKKLEATTATTTIRCAAKLTYLSMSVFVRYRFFFLLVHFRALWTWQKNIFFCLLFYLPLLFSSSTAKKFWGEICMLCWAICCITYVYSSIVFCDVYTPHRTIFNIHTRVWWI